MIIVSDCKNVGQYFRAVAYHADLSMYELCYDAGESATNKAVSKLGPFVRSFRSFEVDDKEIDRIYGEDVASKLRAFATKSKV